jgi:hypothetical protein
MLFCFWLMMIVVSALYVLRNIELHAWYQITRQREGEKKAIRLALYV